MKITLSPQRREDFLFAEISGDVLIVNGHAYDFSRMGNGDTLPRAAISDEFFAGDITKGDDKLSLTLLLPNPINYSQEQAFPVPLVDISDGRVALPLPMPDEAGNYPELPPLPELIGPGAIDWTQLVTKAMKDAAAIADHLAAMKAELAARNAQVVTQIARIQDRINTIGYGIDSGDATEEDEAEQAALMVSIAAWKTYKFALGKVTKQPTWPAAPVWPVMPAIPVIVADPEANAADAA